MKGQGVAIGAVVACGIAVFVTALTTLRSLETAKSDYYAKNRFAEVFASLTRAPAAIASRAGEIPGVSAAEARIVASSSTAELLQFGDRLSPHEWVSPRVCSTSWIATSPNFFLAVSTTKGASPR